MSNVHQLVNELATYEQQRKQLENDLVALHRKFDEDQANAVDSDTFLPDSYIDHHFDQVETLEENLDNIWIKIDNLNALIEEDSTRDYGYSEDDY